MDSRRRSGTTHRPAARIARPLDTRTLALPSRKCGRSSLIVRFGTARPIVGWSTSACLLPSLYPVSRRHRAAHAYLPLPIPLPDHLRSLPPAHPEFRSDTSTPSRCAPCRSHRAIPDPEALARVAPDGRLADVLEYHEVVLAVDGMSCIGHRSRFRSGTSGVRSG